MKEPIYWYNKNIYVRKENRVFDTFWGALCYHFKPINNNIRKAEILYFFFMLISNMAPFFRLEINVIINFFLKRGGAYIKDSGQSGRDFISHTLGGSL